MTLNRVFLICLTLIGVAWISLYIVDATQRADDKAFYGSRLQGCNCCVAAVAKRRVDRLNAAYLT
jgi:hypothetical protein